MQSQISSTLQILLARFNGQVLIPFIPASESIGISQQTARNQLSNGTYPIRTELRGSRRFVHISDLAGYVDSSRSESTKQKRGPKTKASKFQAEQGGA
jgi:hypothetical protein